MVKLIIFYIAGQSGAISYLVWACCFHYPIHKLNGHQLKFKRQRIIMLTCLA